MSFSIEVKGTPGELAQAIDEAVSQEVANPDSNVRNAKELDLVESIKVHVTSIARRIATNDETVKVSISGHANPSTDKVEGWASNSLTIAITQVYAKQAKAEKAE